MDIKTQIRFKQQQIDWYEARIAEIQAQLERENCPDKDYLQHYLEVTQEGFEKTKNQMRELKLSYKQAKTEV